MDTQTVDVDTLEAGPEINNLIASRVMGWHLAKVKVAGADFYRPVEAYVEYWVNENDTSQIQPYEFDPSLDIAVAWQVIDQIMQTYSHEVTVEHGWQEHPGPYWHCHMGLVDATADTPALAVCRAALKTVSGNKE